MASEKYKLTAEGKEELEREYRQILDVENPKVIKQLQEARAMGDLSENADYDAARDLQAKLHQREKESIYCKVSHTPCVEQKQNGACRVPFFYKIMTVFSHFPEKVFVSGNFVPLHTI